MASAQTASVADGWTLARDAIHTSRIGREYTRIAYAADDGTVVRIATVQEPNSFGGWGYLVWTVGSGAGELGLVETLGEATDLAAEYMRSYGGEDR